MNLTFEKIKIENFMSFEYAELDLSANGFVSIVGQNHNEQDNALSNGSGKSAIFEALNWCLIGETLRGSKDIVRHNSDGGALVELSFKADKDSFVITRTRNHSKFKNNLFITKNGEDVSGKGLKDTEALLSQYLPAVTSELINSVVVLGQGLPMRFTNNTPSGRKEVLESLSNSDFMITDLKTRIANRSAELKKSLTDTTLDKTKKETEISFHNSQLEVLNKELLSLNEIDLESLKMCIIRDKQLADECDAKIGELLHKYGCTPKEKQEELNNRKFDLYSEQKKKESAVKDAYNVKALEKTKDKAELDALVRVKSSEITRLKSVTDICPTCGQKLPNVHKVDTTELEKEVEDLKAQVDKLKNEISLIDGECRKELGYISEEYDLLLADVEMGLKSVSADLQELADLQIEENSYLNTIEKCEEQLKHHSIRLENCEEAIKDCEEKVKELTAGLEFDRKEEENLTARLAVHSKFETALKRDFRGILLQNCISYIDGKAKEYCKKIFHTDLINFSLDGNNVSISYCGKEYESMSGGEKQKIDLIIQFAIRDMLCKYLNFSCNLLVLDELTDSMDAVGCKNAIDFIASEFDDIDSVFIISHRLDLEIPYDKIITVYKNNEGISGVLQ